MKLLKVKNKNGVGFRSFVRHNQAATRVILQGFPRIQRRLRLITIIIVSPFRDSTTQDC
jgi:hypothetical protein